MRRRSIKEGRKAKLMSGRKCGEFTNRETQLFPMEKKPVQWLVRQEGGTRDHAEGNARPARLEGDT
jgi:hypothetical protein